MLRPQRLSWALLAVVAAFATWWVLANTVQPTQPEPHSTAGASTISPDASTDPRSGLPVVDVSDLPAEAAETLELIEQGGPFPEEEDGGTFGNREEILPDQSVGYYREYTVSTPGSVNRGARRIVAGEVGEFYWTADHYRSFSRIAQ